MDNTLYSLTISARATLDMHSLNNEGGEGNQIQTRMVNVVDSSGRLHSVNAISGDMWKHIQAEHLFHLLAGRKDIPLCAGCRQFNANRMNADDKFLSYLGETETYKDKKGKNKKRAKYNDAQVLDYMLAQCALDDIEGILITSKGVEQTETQDGEDEETDADEPKGGAGKRSLPRKSIVEFGWVVGIPGHVTSDSYFHVKYASDRSSGRRSEDRESTEETGANLGQAIFHRPASSGIYAVVGALELSRIGFNDITQKYAIDEAQRRLRYSALLESLLYAFIEPRGAMRSTQSPHLVALEGVIAISTRPTPAPTVSPIKDGYDQEIERIIQALEPLHPKAVTLMRFSDLAQLTEHITTLIRDTVPFTLRYA